MFEDTYKTIAAAATGSYSEKRSKFLAYAFPVKTEEEVKKHLAELQKQYYDARHHCYAYILGPHKEAYRLNDNGEPSGTAGRPIHGQLLSKDLTDPGVTILSQQSDLNCTIRFSVRLREADRIVAALKKVAVSVTAATF